jgi:hypothetical protein
VATGLASAAKPPVWALQLLLSELEVSAAENGGPRALLSILDTKARDDLRRVLIRDQSDREAISSHLLRYRDGRGDDWADIIDMLTMDPEERRRVVRLLGEIEAGS